MSDYFVDQPYQFPLDIDAACRTILEQVGEDIEHCTAFLGTGGPQVKKINVLVNDEGCTADLQHLTPKKLNRICRELMEFYKDFRWDVQVKWDPVMATVVRSDMPRSIIEFFVHYGERRKNVFVQKEKNDCWAAACAIM